MEAATHEPKAKRGPSALAQSAAKHPIETLAREVFLRFLELPGRGSSSTEYLAAQAVEYAEAFYVAWDQLKAEK